MKIQIVDTDKSILQNIDTENLDEKDFRYIQDKFQNNFVKKYEIQFKDGITIAEINSYITVEESACVFATITI